MNTIQILMIGADLGQRGGIATVENIILKHSPSDFCIHHIVAHKEGRLLLKLQVFTQCICQLLWRLLFHPTDIVYIHISDGGSLLRKSIIALICFVCKKPVLLHTHGPKFPETHARIPRLFQRLINYIFGQCKAVIVLSNSWRDYYTQTCQIQANKVIVLVNPTVMPVSLSQHLDNRQTVNLLCCGRIGHRKGTFDLIQAFALLPRKISSRAKLTIAGDGEVEAGKQLVSSLNLTDRVSFPGWVNSQTREQLLADSDIFILPSYHEGLPMSILEAMSWGLPVISTPVGGIPEILHDHHNGLLIDPGDLEQLSQAMESLIEDRNLRLSLGKEARASVQPFDIKNYWDKLSDVFDQVLI